jgi:hypothetical protein
MKKWRYVKMSENNIENKDPTKIKIILDNSPALVEANEVIKKQAEKIGSLEESTRALLADRKKEFEDSMPFGRREPPVGGDSAPLEQPKQEFDLTNSDIDISWAKSENPLELIAYVEQRAKLNNEDSKEAKEILSKLTKKVIDSKFDYTFTGSNKEFMKSPLEIRGFDSEETKQLKQAYNEKLRRNRTENWRKEA